jgi:RimJ/RimL family protein N-acetyltransferase
MTREELARWVAPFFASDPTLPAVVDGVLRGGLGTIDADDEAQPRMARLSIGCYEIFGGDPEARRAERLAASVASGKEIVYGNRPDWRAYLLERLGHQVSDRPMQTFDPGALSLESLKRHAASPLAEGYELRRLDAAWAAQLDAELAPHALQVFESPTVFAERGVGYGIVAGSVLAAAATTYTISPSSAEIAIATRASHRQRGLAMAAAARLMQHCLENGLTPRWSASNPVSIRLALRLGFRSAGLCEVLLHR